jgi:uncharacterized protein involved in outer membrane biogenesis
MPRRIFKYVGLSIAVVVVLVVAAACVFWLTFDPNSYRALIADTVSDALEREVSIGGEIELVPALVPTLAVNDISIANPPWASRPTMASAGRLEIQLVLRPLLDGQIELVEVVLEQVDVLLERDPDGRGNWEFAFLTEPSAAEPSGGGLQAQVDRIELRDITARYSQPSRTDLSTRVDLVTLERSPEGQLLIAATGSANGLPIVAEWQAGPLDDAGTDPELRWPVAATVSLGDTTVEMTGRLRAPAAYTRSDLELHISGRNAAQLQALVDLPPSEGLIYDLRGSVRVDADSVRVENLSGSLIEGNIFRATQIDSGSVTLIRGAPIEAEFAGTASELPFTLSARLGLLSDVLQATAPWPLDIEGILGESTLQASGEVAPGDAGNRASIELAIRGTLLESLNQLRPFGLPALGPIELDTELVADPSQLELSDFRFAFGGGAVSGDIAVTNLAATPNVAANLTASSVDLAAISAALPPSSDETPLRDRPLPIDWLGSVSGSVEIELGELLGLPVLLGDAAMNARLADGVLDLVEMNARVAGVALQGSGSLRQTADGASVELDVAVQPVGSVTLLPALGLADVPGLAWSAGPLALTLSAQGSSIAAAAETSAIDLGTRPAEIVFERDGASANVALTSLDVSTDPGGAVRLESEGRLVAEVAGETIDEPFGLVLTAGTLSELVSTQRLWPVVEISAHSIYREQPVTLTAQIGDTAALMSRSQTPVQLDAIWGRVEASINGELVPTADLAGTSADIELQSRDLSAAAALLGFDGLPSGDSSASARVSIRESEFALSDLTVALPEVDMSGELTLVRSDRLGGRADLQFGLLDATAYVTQSEPEQDAQEETQAFAVHELFSPEPFEPELLRRGDLELQASVDTFRLGQFVSSDIDVELALEQGTLQVDASLDGGRVSVSSSLDARQDEIGLDFRVSGDAVPLAVDRTAEPEPETPVISIDAMVAGRGASSEALAQDLGGELELYLTGGRIRDSGFRFLFGSVLYELLEIINPFSQRQGYMDIECVGAYFDVADGVLSTRNGIIVQTPELQIVGVGTTSLADGALQMQFRTKRRTGIVMSIGAIVNEFVELSGMLDAPRVQMSTSRASTTGLLALATGGLSLLATDMFGRLTSGDVCEDLPERVGAPKAGGN